MYEVTIYDGIADTIGTVIHSPYPNSVKLSSGKVKTLLQGISNMSFSINLKNPGWGKIKPLITLIKVRDLKRNKDVFNGRILKPVQQMSSDGMFSIEYVCESTMAYLNDSNQRFGEYHNISVKDFFTIMINNHNRQVEPHKRFKIGNVTVMDPNNSLYRYLGYEKTFATIKDKLLDRLGGYLVIREESDGAYIDYLAEVGGDSSTEIRLRKNLKDMKREIDPLGIISRLVVLGAKIENKDENTTDASQARIDIRDVNGGLDYIDDQALIDEFGIIEGTLELDNVNDKNILMARGRQFFADQKAAKITYSLTPVDVSLIDSSFEELVVGNRYPIINQVFGINEMLQIIEKETDIVDPLKISLTIGEKYQTLTQYQVDYNKRIKNIVQLERTVDSQTETIGTLKNQIETINKTVTLVNTELSEADLPGLNKAIDTLNQAIVDLNETVGVIPVYQPATSTTDGLLTSQDKAKLDLITVLQSIDLDALKTKLDLISVINPVDLDQLAQRVTDLEGGGA